MRPTITLLTVLIPLSLLCVDAGAVGILIPKDEKLPPLAIKTHRVDIRVTDSAAVTRVEQVFVNHTDRPLEATFYFPVPKGSTVSDMNLWINGKKTPGAVLEKGKARATYERIVRRVQDPGLVEYIDGAVFQARIFPVPARGEQKVEIAYAGVLEKVGDMRRMVYPLRTGRASAQLLEDFVVDVKIDSKQPLGGIYSPSHRIDVGRASDQHVRVGLEETGADLEEDFLLYIGTRDSEVAASVLSFDPDGKGGEDAWFLMVLSPGMDIDEDDIAPKAVTFVVDTSGSMSGDKMKQARSAVEGCLGKLREQDTFNVVAFSTSVRRLFARPMPATRDRLATGVQFVRGLDAAGGTAIDDALATALDRGPDDRAHYVIFVTDGRPTVGEVEMGTILGNLKKHNRHDARIFPLAVGYDINPALLEAVADNHGGITDYVRPGEDVALRVSALYDRIAFPVMTDLALDFGSHKVHDVYPRKLPDLFRGGQLVVMGRTPEPLGNVVRLTGNYRGDRLGIEFEELDAARGGEGNDAHDFIPQLWATRKVGYLLDQIRANGESSELKTEVIRLATDYGLVTPYTSYLAVDDSELEGRRNPGIARGGLRGGGGGGVRYEFDDVLVEGHLRSPRNKRKMANEQVLVAPGNFDARAGKGAVDLSRATSEMKRADNKAQSGAVRSRHVGGKLYTFEGGAWKEAGSKGKKTRKVKYLSKEWFDLADKPANRRKMAVGRSVAFEDEGEFILVE